MMYNTIRNINFGTLPDWIVACATLIAAGLAIYIYLRSKKEESQRFLSENMPVLTLGSPCDVTQNSCETNICDYNDTNENGATYFSIGNFSKTTAYDLIIEISKNLDLEIIDRTLYIQEVPVTTLDFNNSPIYIYSKYHIDPETRETKFDNYDLSNLLNDCKYDQANNCIKKLYLRFKYSSSPNMVNCFKMESIFTVSLECTDGTDSHKKGVKIKSIVRNNYHLL